MRRHARQHCSTDASTMATGAPQCSVYGRMTRCDRFGKARRLNAVGVHVQWWLEKNSNARR